MQLAKALACAWAKDNIQVNAVLPGWIDSALTRRARRDMAGLEERVVAHAGRPLGHAGRLRRRRGVFASPASDFITGAAITVDGGYSVQACDWAGARPARPAQISCPRATRIDATSREDGRPAGSGGS